MSFSTLRLSDALVPLQKGAKKSWSTSIILDDGTIEDITGKIVGIISTNAGINTTVVYGSSDHPSAGFDQWNIRQGPIGGMKGGASILPWTRVGKRKKIHVLVAEEWRHLIDRHQRTFCPAGGFLGNFPTHGDAAIRKTAQKVGLEIPLEILELLFGGVCTNAAFFDILPTPGMEPNGNGDYFYTCELPGEMFVQDEDVWRPDRTIGSVNIGQFVVGVLAGVYYSRLVPLFPIGTLLGASDADLIVAVGRLLTHLESKGEIIIKDTK